MSTLSTPLRRQLENGIKQARTGAAAGARKALEALAVHEPEPYRHMHEAQRDLRRKLRAQARQLGDAESQSKRGAYEIRHLVEKLAYDQWHRLLFARYLLENHLLISPEHGVAVALDDCEELAPSLGLKDAWAVAARFAAVELPEIFRADDPAGGVELPVEDRKGLIQLVTGLPLAVFTASDSLGWCYQFWQAERKDQVNAAGNKIGADELPSVTQLFTEDYMVDFLLDNTLGAWHAARCAAVQNSKLQIQNCPSEEAARRVCALPGCEWHYLRFVQKTVGGVDVWTPAAGTFEGWPKTAKELKCLDPCMGSGHFVVAMFERLVALRLTEEKLTAAAAVAAVIRDNLFGLEIDPRCTQIAAFNLALAAWRRVGHCKLPAMHLACSGLAPNAKREDWLKLTEGAPHLRFQMGALYDLFEKAPVLGSLINPRADKAVTYGEALHELQPLLDKALAQETKDDPAQDRAQDSTHEMAVTARGLAKAAEILAGQFTLVATNVPYLGQKKQADTLKDYCERCHFDAKADLATCFIERCLSFCISGASAALVTPQNWLFMSKDESLRRKMLPAVQWDFVARLGSRAFETIGGEVVNVVLLGFTSSEPRSEHCFVGWDVADSRDPVEKATHLVIDSAVTPSQQKQITNPNARITFDEIASSIPKLADYCSALSGAKAGDTNRFNKYFWEIATTSLGRDWEFYQTAPNNTGPFESREMAVFWQKERGEMFDLAQSVRHINHVAQNWLRGKPNWQKSGVVVALMGGISATIYSGEIYDSACCAIVPNSAEHVLALWAFCESGDYTTELRKIDQALNIGATGTLLQVPFDLAHWQKVAAEKYPHGLPKPFSCDPTQWLFDGHPAGADQPLQVAVARLLGYQWPRQTGSSFPDCGPLAADGLETLADADGIVPISPVLGEAAAAERLRELLARAYGKDWNAPQQQALLAQVGYAGASLEDWLRNGFFEQHCALFHQRPFIWHIWDGLKNGFSALVNTHKLTHANLEKLTYSYLGDWIRRQQAAVEAGEAGSDARLQAAKQLQTVLKLILAGEPPYDIFVRWKPLAQQAIGWHPDLNDGVRMNIRPFLAQDLPNGKKGAGILRAKPNIKWEKDRGKEPSRDKAEYPWFWGWDEATPDFSGGREFDGNRWNDCHYSNEMKRKARKL